MAIPRDVKKAMRIIKTYCTAQDGCWECDIREQCQLCAPHLWDLDIIDIQLGCLNSNICSDVITAQAKATKEKNKNKRLTSEVAILEVQKNTLEKILNENVPNWKSFIGDKK